MSAIALVIILYALKFSFIYLGFVFQLTEEVWQIALNQCLVPMGRLSLTIIGWLWRALSSLKLPTFPGKLGRFFFTQWQNLKAFFKFKKEKQKKKTHSKSHSKKKQQEDSFNFNQWQPPPKNEKSSQTPFDILGVDKSASMNDIKRAFRNLSHQYHPDKVQNLGEEFKRLAHDKFKAITQAYNQIKQLKNRNDDH